MLSCFSLLLPLLLPACAPVPPQVVGVVWQPDNDTAQPHGNWDRLGVHKLLVQWSVVDDVGFIDGCGVTQAANRPDWQRIAAAPWAQEVIVGLAGRFDERQARNNLQPLIAQSLCIAAQPTPLKVAGWYFPVEIDPSWQDAPQLAAALNQLPRPLWVSVYDNTNVGPEALADWLQRWLPADVGVFFQDGVGVYAREPRVAAQYFKSLQGRFGKSRVHFIAEAFRPAQDRPFRAATAAELLAQLHAYSGYELYLFEGPRYVSDAMVEQLRPALKK